MPTPSNSQYTHHTKQLPHDIQSHKQLPDIQCHTFTGLCGVSSPDRAGMATAALALGVLLAAEGLEGSCRTDAADAAAMRDWRSLLLPLPVLISVDPLPASFFDLRRHI